MRRAHTTISCRAFALIAVLIVASISLPSVKAAVEPKIDYLGILFIGLAATGLTLVTV